MGTKIFSYVGLISFVLSIVVACTNFSSWLGPYDDATMLVFAVRPVYCVLLMFGLVGMMQLNPIILDEIENSKTDKKGGGQLLTATINDDDFEYEEEEFFCGFSWDESYLSNRTDFIKKLWWPILYILNTKVLQGARKRSEATSNNARAASGAWTRSESKRRGAIALVAERPQQGAKRPTRSGETNGERSDEATIILVAERPQQQ